MKQGVFKVIPVSSPQANLLHKKPFYPKFFLVIVTLVVLALPPEKVEIAAEKAKINQNL